MTKMAGHNTNNNGSLKSQLGLLFQFPYMRLNYLKFLSRKVLFFLITLFPFPPIFQHLDSAVWSYRSIPPIRASVRPFTTEMR